MKKNVIEIIPFMIAKSQSYVGVSPYFNSAR